MEQKWEVAFDHAVYMQMGRPAEFRLELQRHQHWYLIHGSAGVSFKATVTSI